jgi:pimeloyl-ACP methyl ester carboxylesterase
MADVGRPVGSRESNTAQTSDGRAWLGLHRRNTIRGPAAVPNFLMASDKPPLVLLHGITMSGNAWQDVVPLLSDHHEVFTPTALGHRGGPPVQRRPATITDVVDAAQRYLDERGLERPHLAGNSMGGFMAIELARRGRAATVCAFSPAGFCSAGFQALAMGKIQRGIALARRVRSILPFMYKSATVRRLMLRDVAWHGDRVSADRALEAIDEGIDCAILADLCAAEWQIAPLDPLPCPITIAWGEKETLLPVEAHGKTERIPQASIKTLPGVSHVPMIDDPGLVARTILAGTGAAKN